MSKSHPVRCVEHGRPPRRLGIPETIIITVIITLATILWSRGAPLEGVLQILMSAGLTAVVVIYLATGASSRVLWGVLRSLLAASL